MHCMAEELNCVSGVCVCVFCDHSTILKDLKIYMVLNSINAFMSVAHAKICAVACTTEDQNSLL